MRRFVNVVKIARQWRHVAFFDEARSRIEMHLEAREAITCTWPGGSRHFAAGARVHTENSCKYRVGQFESMLVDAGFERPRHWTDPLGWFAVFWAEAR